MFCVYDGDELIAETDRDGLWHNVLDWNAHGFPDGLCVTGPDLPPEGTSDVEVLARVAARPGPV